eukprot:3753812-Rhodomonas_salina.2
MTEPCRYTHGKNGLKDRASGEEHQIYLDLDDVNSKYSCRCPILLTVGCAFAQIEGLAQLLCTGTTMGKERAVGALQNLAVLSECRVRIATAPGALKGLASLLWYHSLPDRVTEGSAGRCGNNWKPRCQPRGYEPQVNNKNKLVLLTFTTFCSGARIRGTDGWCDGRACDVAGGRDREREIGRGGGHRELGGQRRPAQ